MARVEWVVMEDDIDVVNAGVGCVDDVAEVESEGLSLVLDEEGVVFSDVFLDGPEDAVSRRLGGAAAEKLCAVEPEAEDAVELSASAGGSELEGDSGELLGRAVGGESVVGEDGGFGVGVGEVVVEELVGAGLLLSLRRRGDGWLFDLEVASW